MLMGYSNVNWCSKKQHEVALSSCEAENITCSMLTFVDRPILEGHENWSS